MKLVTKYFDPSRWRWFHANLDHLAELQRIHNASNSAEISKHFSNILKDVYINGFAKFTFPGRLPVSQAAIARLLAEKKENAPYEIMDLGASDGNTTHDLAEELRKKGLRKFRVILADLNPYVDRFSKLGFVEYRSISGAPILLRWGPLAWRLPSPDRRSAIISKGLISLYLRLGRFRDSFVKTERLILISPATLADTSIEINEMNCLTKYPHLANRFDVIRAANILNLCYFNETQLQTAIANIHDYLNEGGYFVVERNPDEDAKTENGSIFQKTDRGFKHIEDFGSGSEIGLLIRRYMVIHNDKIG